MKYSFNRQLKVVFGIALILLIGVGIFSFNNITGLIENSADANKTTRIMLSLESVISQVKDAETAQRGFLLTRNADLLMPFEGSKERVESEIEVIRVLTENDSVQNKLLDSLENLVYYRFGALNKVKQADTLGLATTTFIKKLITDGDKIMDQTRSVVNTMIDNEQSSIRAKSLKVQDSSRNALFIIPTFSMITLIIMLLALYQINVELKRRERTQIHLEQYSAELNRSNKELEQFAYVASHDLQEPLRKIRAFGDRLETKFMDKLGDQGVNYISRMKSAAERMQVLIDDLLGFSRVSKKPSDFEKIDLSIVVRNLLSDIETVIEEKKARVFIEDLPKLHADPSQMRQLFQNLVSNAIKFCPQERTPEIVINSHKVNNFEGLDFHFDPKKEYIQINVRDNGIGFDEKYLTRIFTIFQRLHGRNEYEGTGIGLAMCRKILDHHKGMIWASSKEGVGSTFHIILPL